MTTNESKVVRYDLKLEHCDLIKEDRSGRFVTHADYKALEEQCTLLANANVKLASENAELKAKAAEVAMYRNIFADVAKWAWAIESDQGDKIREVICNALKEEK